MSFLNRGKDKDKDKTAKDQASKWALFDEVEAAHEAELGGARPAYDHLFAVEDEGAPAQAGGANAGKVLGAGGPFTAEHIGANRAPWIDSLVDDKLCEPPDMRVLSGYLGASSRQPKGDWWRLYFTLELNHFVDIPANDILFVSSAGDEPLAGVTVWVRKDSPIWHMYIASEHVLVQHLRQGDLAQHFLPQVNVPTRTSPDGPSGERPVDPPSIYRMC